MLEIHVYVEESKNSLKNGIIKLCINSYDL